MQFSEQVHKLVQLAIEEDLGGGDLTSELSVPDSLFAHAKIEARQGLCCCGLAVVPIILDEIDAEVDLQLEAQDGCVLEAGAAIARLSGRARSLLAAERTILNFMQRLSGVATYTNAFVRQVPEMLVLDTRKTTPGWRELEKYAVRTGGGTNHRMHLSDLIMVKDNHIDAFLSQEEGVGRSQGLGALLQRVQKDKPAGMQVEVEVRDQQELRLALDAEVDFVMLDNMSDPEIKEALEIVEAHPASPRVEVSGGITVERACALFALGVRCVSVGALTHQATSVDIAMSISI